AACLVPPFPSTAFPGSASACLHANGLTGCAASTRSGCAPRSAKPKLSPTAFFRRARPLRPPLLQATPHATPRRSAANAPISAPRRQHLLVLRKSAEAGKSETKKPVSRDTGFYFAFEKDLCGVDAILGNGHMLGRKRRLAQNIIGNLLRDHD